MKSRMLYLSILAICLLSVAGYFPVFKIEQWQIHHKIEALIEQSFSNQSLQIISIATENQHELTWERVNKEFWYKGQLFDIVRQVKTNGIIHYYCIQDTCETLLTYQFIENIKKQTDGSDNENTPLSNFFKKQLKIYFPTTSSTDTPIEFITILQKEKVYLPYLNLYASIFYNRIDAPPKRLV
jgi:hypothetical protein